MRERTFITFTKYMYMYVYYTIVGFYCQKIP
nr:MAG TPA: hypothetical protein [Caudoviricetes sp.]